MATLPSFRTWVAGEVVVAAYFNSNVRDAGNFFLSWPVFEGRQTVAQSLTTGVTTAITMDSEDIDTDNGHSTVTNTDRYTAQTQGRFQVSGAVSYASNATGLRSAEIGKNGAVIVGGSALYPAVSGNTTRAPTRTMTTFMNGSTDFAQIYGFQSSGGALSTAVGGGGIEDPTMSVRMVGTT